jgi:hypothetical protein
VYTSSILVVASIISITYADFRTRKPTGVDCPLESSVDDRTTASTSGFDG